MAIQTAQENISALLAQLQRIDQEMVATEAPVAVTETLATLVLVLLRDHPERKKLESLTTQALTSALDIVETSMDCID